MPKKRATDKIIQYTEKKEISEEQQDVWNLFTGNFFLTKKEVSPSSKNKLYNLFPELRPIKKEKIALVLGGGGAKGLAHVGILKELEKYDVEVDFIAATSMGAIIGALYALEGNVNLIKQFTDVKSKDLISINDVSLSMKGILKGNIVEEILRGLYGNSTFEDTKVELAVNAVDVETGEEKIFRNGKLLDAVRASMSIPLVFMPKKIEGHLYVDGGLANNLPYNLVPKKYKKVIVCNVSSKIPKITKSTTGLKYFRHFISVIEHNATEIPNDKRVIYLAPETVDIFTEEFHRVKEAIQRGHDVCKDVFPKYFKKKADYINKEKSL